MHLLVGRAGGASRDEDANAARVTLLDESELLGLGPHVDRHAALGAARIEELVRTLAGYVAAARSTGAGSIVLLGAEPLRRAGDAARAVRAVEEATALPLHVLTPREEALLTVLGVAGGATASPVAVIDVGGGSTEVALAAPDGTIRVHGLPVGAARLSSRHVIRDPVAAQELAALRAAASDAVRPLGRLAERELDGPDRIRVVAVGGTADNLLRLLTGSTGDGRLSASDLETALATLGAEPAEATAARTGMRPTRARLLPAGAAILLAVLDALGVAATEVSRRGMRDGALEALRRDGPWWRDRLGG